MSFDPAKLKALQEKQKGATQLGGKGTVRRKHKVVHKNTAADDKKIKAAVAKLNCRDIPAIEEVNFFRKDGKVLHFKAPKVSANVPANTYVVAGQPQVKDLQELLPGIIHQLSSDNLDDLKRIVENLAPGAGAEDDDADVPNLVSGNFEDAAKGDEDDEVPSLVPA